jgi:hypothetical protein
VELVLLSRQFVTSVSLYWKYSYTQHGNNIWKFGKKSCRLQKIIKEKENFTTHEPSSSSPPPPLA